MSTFDPRAEDREARALAVAEFERPVALGAGAGTGKTRALVARLATWLLGPGWDDAAARLLAAGTLSTFGEDQERSQRIAEAAVSGVVAITFTEAAAAEMSQRLGKAISELSSTGAALDLDPMPVALDGVEIAARARILAPLLSRLAIQTIHGFCYRLLTSNPFDAGLHPAAQVDAEGERLVEIATGVLLARLRAHDQRLVELLADGIAPEALLETLRQLVDKGVRPAELASERFDPATTTALIERLAGALEIFLPALRRLVYGAPKSTSLPPVLALLEAVEANLRQPGAEPVVRLDSAAALLREDRESWAKVFSRWRKSGFNQGESKVAAGDAVAILAAAGGAEQAVAATAPLQPRLFEAARRALLPLVEEVRVRLQREGALSYDELLLRAVELLEARAAVRRRLRREIRQLLVDEFQDTDRRQCRLLELLALGGEDGPRPGLFVVGDPKQSIYSWRSADLAAYEGFLREMGAAGGLRRSLVVNYRSRPAVLAEVERLVAPPMQEVAGVQPAFEPLIAHRDDAPDAFAAGRSAVEHWVAWPAEGRGARVRLTSAQATALEAGAIAREIAALAREGRPFSQFALLLRTRGDLDVYLEALRRAGVPYAVEKDRSYYRRREVIDLACAVRAILDPADLLALVAFLRSPLVGVPDAAWISLWRGGFATALANLEGHEAATLAELETIVEIAARQTPGVDGIAAFDTWPRALIATLHDLARLRGEFSRLPAAVWVERLRARLLPEPLAAARFLGRFGLANVRRLLARLERDFASTADPHRVLAGLRRGIEEELDAGDALPPDTSAEAVRVMTIHTAKGLQFDQVFLAQLHKAPRRDPPVPDFEVVEGEPSPERGGAPALEMVLFSAPSPAWNSAHERRALARRAEYVRLLYVGATRARERLVLSGAWPRQAKALDLERAETFADLVAARRPENLALLAEQEVFESPTGSLWRRLAAATAEFPAVVAAAAIPGLGAAVSPAARQAARARSVRRRVATVSAGAEADLLQVGLGRERSRRISRALGTAVHRGFERAPMADVDPARWQALVASSFETALGTPTADEQETLAGACERLLAGPLWRRLTALGNAVVARELPLLVSAQDRPEGPSSAESAPLEAYVGILDLLYRDPESGEWVVADFKTDELGDEGDSLAQHAERYRSQLETYGRAVHQALDLEAMPRLELWFVAKDRIEVVHPRRVDRPSR